jgi:RNA polymerase sigma factor (sigma-70 family)
MPDDAELLSRYVNDHCEASFAEFVRRHIGVVYNAALRRVNGNTHLAEEIVQGVFIHAARKSRALARHPAVLGWLHTSTRYAAAVSVRREVRRLARERAAQLMDPEATSDDTLPWESLRPWLDEALDRLGEADRQAVLLRYFAGRSFAEIGAELQVSEEASRKRVDRALDSLRGQLARRGITTTGVALTVALTAAPALAAPAGLAATVAGAATAVAAGGSLATGFTVFMSTVKLHSLTGAAATLAGIALLGTVTLVTQLAHQRREQAQLDASQAQVSAERSRLARRTVEAVAQARAGDQTRAAASMAPVPPPPTASPAANESLRRLELRAASADYAPFRQQELRLRVQREFGAFFAQRGYPPDKIETLTRALALVYEAEEAHQLAVASASAAGTVKPDANLVEETKLVMEQIKEFLGEEENEQMRRYALGYQKLGAVRNFAYDLADAGLPLTSAQELALATTLAASRDPAQNPDTHRLQSERDPATAMTGLEHWQLEQAKAYLAPEQWRRFETYLRDEAARAALRARVRG